MQKTVLAILTLVLLVPVAQGHGAPAPQPQFTRLLHDHNDDCGGDGVTSNCRGSLDIIALDVQELHDGSDQVLLRFTLDKGQAGTHRITLSYDAPDGRKTLETSSTDQAKFTGGFDQLSTKSAGDGSRFWLEARTASEKAGLSAGATLRNFRVEARRDGTLGDFMPGGYQGPLGPVQDPPQGDGPTNYVKSDYRARGASYYIQITTASVSGSNGQAMGKIQVRNLLDTAQTVTVRLASATADATFSGGTGEKVVDLARKGTQDMDLQITGSGEGEFTVTATTDLGGKSVQTGRYTIAPVTSSPTGPTDDSTGPSKGSPAIPLVLTAMALLVAARRRR